MNKICKPYKSAKPNDITQKFGVNPQGYQPNGHTGVDYVSSYGTFLVAPEDCEITNIISNPEQLDESEAPLERGFGLVMRSLSQNDIYYLYWHCLGVFPVQIGDKVKQGQPVAQMGNSGFCMTRGVIVPIDIRNIKPYTGTHLHAEMFKERNGKREFQDITRNMDYTIPVNYDALTTIQIILQKIFNILKGK